MQVGQLIRIGIGRENITEAAENRAWHYSAFLYHNAVALPGRRGRTIAFRIAAGRQHRRWFDAALAVTETDRDAPGAFYAGCRPPLLIGHDARIERIAQDWNYDLAAPTVDGNSGIDSNIAALQARRNVESARNACSIEQTAQEPALRIEIVLLELKVRNAQQPSVIISDTLRCAESCGSLRVLTE
jgi:hypothetical protein